MRIRRTRSVAMLAALGAAVLSFNVHANDGLRCGSKLVVAGESRASVRSKCGDPVDVTHQTIFRRPTFVFRGRLYHGDEEAVEVENWTYNLGPNHFMRRVRFVDGIVENIETLDYGYHETR
jgi:hypothetical protein